MQKTPLTEETPLFEDLNEEIKAEEKQNDTAEITQSAGFENVHDLRQPELDIDNKQAQVDDDMLDLPTEKQEDLEEYIDKINSEEPNDEPQAAEEIPPIKTNDNAIEQELDVKEPSDLFEDEPNIEAETNELHNEKSFDDEPSGIEETMEYEDKEVELSKKASGFFAKLIYTLITLGALFVIIIASLVILINAQILPKGSLSNLTTSIESIIPFELTEKDIPLVIITEHKARWMNTINGPVYIVSGLISNESNVPVHYVKLRSEFIAADKKQFEDLFYAGNTFTDKELKGSPIETILLKLDQRNGDIDVNNTRKLAGLNYNIQPGESIPFFSVFPAEGRMLGLKYNLEVIDYKEDTQN